MIRAALPVTHAVASGKPGMGNDSNERLVDATGSGAFPAMTPSTATSTHAVQGSRRAVLYGSADAVDLTTNVPLASPLSPAIRNGWAASCSPQPYVLTSAAVAHSDSHTLLPGSKPRTVTCTVCPSTSSAYGVTSTVAPVAAKALREPISPVRTAATAAATQ